MAVETGSRERTAARWGDAAGIAFVVLFFLGMSVLGTPDSDAPAAEWEAWFDDSGNRGQSLLSMFLIVISAFAFLWFATSLRGRLQAAAEQLQSVASAAAVLFVTMVAVTGVVFGAVAASVEFGDGAVPDGETIVTLEQLGFGLLLIAGGFSAALFTASVSALGSRAGVFPRWLATVGYVAAVLLLFSFMFFPFLAVLIWVLIVSIRSLASPSSSGAGASATP